MAINVNIPLLNINLSIQTINQSKSYPCFGSFSTINQFSFFKKLDSSYDNESNLFSNTQAESYNQNAIESFYYDIDYDTNKDPIFQEDIDKGVLRKFTFNCYNPDLPEENEEWNKWGIQDLDTFDVHINKNHFREASRYNHLQNTIENTSIVPKVGHIINLKHNNYFYEITNVSETMKQFHQRQHTWTLSLKKYIISNDLSLAPETSATMDTLQSVLSADDIFNKDSDIDNEKPNFEYDDTNDPVSHDDDPFNGW